MNQQAISPQRNGEALASLEKLESRIQSTIEQLRSARRKEATAEEQVERLKELLAGKEREVERLTAELAGHRSEREQVRSRVENLLTQIDQLAE